MEGKVQHMHYVMSDIHGDFEHFLEMLSVIAFSQQDWLYILGDVIDRGHQNVEMLQFCRDTEHVVLLKGNHEYFMELAEKDRLFERQWRAYGGRNTLYQLGRIPAEERSGLQDYVRSLPWYLVLTPKEIPVLDRPYLLTHTGFLRPSPSWNAPDFCYPDLSGLIPFDVERAICWAFKNKPWEYSISNDLYDLPQSVRFDKRLLVGHVPVIAGFAFDAVPYMLQRREYIDLDCGSGYRHKGGRLGCLRLEDMRIWYV